MSTAVMLGADLRWLDDSIPRLSPVRARAPSRLEPEPEDERQLRPLPAPASPRARRSHRVPAPLRALVVTLALAVGGAGVISAVLGATIADLAPPVAVVGAALCLRALVRGPRASRLGAVAVLCACTALALCGPLVPAGFSAAARSVAVTSGIAGALPALNPTTVAFQRAAVAARLGGLESQEVAWRRATSACAAAEAGRLASWRETLADQVSAAYAESVTAAATAVVCPQIVSA